MTKESAQHGLEMKRRQGCFGELSRPLYPEIPGFGELRRCPVAALSAESAMLMRVYPHFDAGRMGMVQDLPGTLVDGCEIIKQTLNRAEREEMEARRNG